MAAEDTEDTEHHGRLRYKINITSLPDLVINGLFVFLDFDGTRCFISTCKRLHSFISTCLVKEHILRAFCQKILTHVPDRSKSFMFSPKNRFRSRYHRKHAILISKVVRGPGLFVFNVAERYTTVKSSVLFDVLLDLSGQDTFKTRQDFIFQNRQQCGTDGTWLEYLFSTSAGVQLYVSYVDVSDALLEKPSLRRVRPRQERGFWGRRNWKTSIKMVNAKPDSVEKILNRICDDWNKFNVTVYGCGC